ncbi:MAG: AAA family ATPase [Bacillota bacterium]|nr:AAA family ATPase [Bacillota bacterium]
MNNILASEITWEQIWQKVGEDLAYWLTTSVAIGVYIFIFAGIIAILCLITILNNFRRPHYQKVALTEGDVTGAEALGVGNKNVPEYAKTNENDASQQQDALPQENEQEHPPRFRALSLIDSGHPSFEARGTDSGLTLASACASFREYAAGTRSLYYSEKTVRAWVSSLCCSRILLLQGMSGTGKTSLPDCFGDWLGRPADVVPVQPTWKERSDLLGYYNEFTGSFSETPLLEALYRAGGTDSVSVIVLDEANIARVEYYFAEFLSLLELPDPNARKLPIASSGMPGDPKRVRDGQLLLPQNAWFVMTANNDDSTFAISDKVYDRAMVLDLDSRAEPFASLPGHRARLSYAGLARLSREACERYSLTRRDRRRIAELDRFLRRELHVSFGNRIMRQVSSFVPCYVACGGSESEALDLILARKVMRKLSSVSPVYVRSKSGELLGLLGNLFGEGGAPECEAAIRRIADSK